MTEPTVTETEPHKEATQPKVDRQALLQSIAQRLVAARQASGQSVEDVMRDLKLRRIYLEALESGNWDDMPGQVYALGFLRQYAAHLHLQMEDEINQLKDGQYELTKPLTYPDPPIAPARKWAVIATVFFVVLFILFNISGRHDEPQNSGVVIPPAPVESVPTAPAPAAPVTEDETTTQTTAPDVPAPAALTETITETPPPAAETGPMHKVDLEAVDSEVWLEVYLPSKEGTQGELYKQKLLQAGDHMLIETALPELLITCGNAAALRIRVDNAERVAAGSLGKPGKVIRDFRLNLESPEQGDLSD